MAEHGETGGQEPLLVRLSLGDVIMKETITHIDEQTQIVKSKESRYLTFIFLEREHGLKLDVAGWTRFGVPANKPENTMGVIHLWGNEIPIIQIPGLTDLAETACIVIFEYSEPYRHYFGIVVDAISNVMNIIEKDPGTVSILETEALDCFGGRQSQYNIVEEANPKTMYDCLESEYVQNYKNLRGRSR